MEEGGRKERRMEVGRKEGDEGRKEGKRRGGGRGEKGREEGDGGRETEGGKQREWERVYIHRFFGSKGR